MAWQQPKTNWDTHPKAIEPADLNRIEGNIEVVREQYNLPLRAQIVTSLPSPGIPGRLVFNNSDKRFYFDTGTSWQVQSAPNLGQVIITPTTSNQTIPEGYHNGTGYVKGDPNLKPENIMHGKTIFGVTGSRGEERPYWNGVENLTWYSSVYDSNVFAEKKPNYLSLGLRGINSNNKGGYFYTRLINVDYIKEINFYIEIEHTKGSYYKIYLHLLDDVTDESAQIAGVDYLKFEGGASLRWYSLPVTQKQGKKLRIVASVAPASSSTEQITELKIYRVECVFL
jgi:hypothetical protein